MTDELFLPPAKASTLSENDVWRFYRNIYVERQIAGLSAEEDTKLFRYDCGFGNMGSRVAYYKQAYIRPFHRAVRAIFTDAEHPRILDVCCGTGMQALFFALMGASVVAIDYDAAQLATLRKRQAVYEKASGRKLAVTVQEGNIKTLDFTALGEFDAVYSHGGAGQFLSAKALFEGLGAVVKPGGLLILKNGNPECWWLRAAGIAPLDSPCHEYLHEAAAHGFAVERARGTTAFPRPLWRMELPLQWLDAVMPEIGALQVHLEYIFRKAS